VLRPKTIWACKFSVDFNSGCHQTEMGLRRA
jgi:hypothetical protein